MGRVAQAPIHRRPNVDCVLPEISQRWSAEETTSSSKYKIQRTTGKGSKNWSHSYLGSELSGSPYRRKLKWADTCGKDPSQDGQYTAGINTLRRRDWGLRGEILKVLYKSGLERIATYACGSCWTGAVVMRVRLNSAQSLDLVAITCCLRSTSTVALQALAGCLPLELQVELEYNKAHLRHFRQAVTFGDTKMFPSGAQFPLSITQLRLLPLIGKWGSH